MPTNKLARCLLRSPLDCRIYLSFDSLIKQFSRRFYTRDIIRIRIKDIYIWSKKFNWQRTYRGRYIENIRENVDERDSSARGPIPLTISIRSTRAFLVHEIDCQFIDTPTRPTMLSLSHFFLIYRYFEYLLQQIRRAMIVSRFVEVAVNRSVRFPTNPSTILTNDSRTKKKEYKNRSELELVTFHLSKFLFSISFILFFYNLFRKISISKLSTAHPEFNFNFHDFYQISGFQKKNKWRINNVNCNFFRSGLSLKCR